MDEEDGSADDDEHIRRDGGEEKTPLNYGGDKQPSKATVGNGSVGNGGIQNPLIGGGVIEKLCIDYPKKYRNVRSMSLSMERNAFCELCRGGRSPVPFDMGSTGSERDDGDKGPAARLYFGFTAKQYMTLASLALVDFLGFCSMSVMAPTFPKEVRPSRSGRVPCRDFGIRRAGTVQPLKRTSVRSVFPRPSNGGPSLFLSGREKGHVHLGGRAGLQFLRLDHVSVVAGNRVVSEYTHPYMSATRKERLSNGKNDNDGITVTAIRNRQRDGPERVQYVR